MGRSGVPRQADSNEKVNACEADDEDERTVTSADIAAYAYAYASAYASDDTSDDDDAE